MSADPMQVRVEGPSPAMAVAWDLAKSFLDSRFSGASRHVRRLAKVAAVESGAA